tara:strand:+ start:2280 stop:2546 length:267 start_codon:yes stop_codon:yes gene_type:complete
MTKDEIQTFIDEDINPGLEMHGGYLLAKDFDDEKKMLMIEMGGGCQGCSSSTVTLKLMIGHALREKFPSLLEIQDVTDHHAGVNPYYG